MKTISAKLMPHADWVNLEPDEVKHFMDKYVVLWSHDYPGYEILIEREDLDD